MAKLEKDQYKIKGEQVVNVEIYENQINELKMQINNLIDPNS